MNTPESYISLLNLGRHPEGGWFREVYRAALQVEVPWSAEKRSASTSIYFLLESGDFSSFHRIKSDEVWHFYDGNALEIFWFDETGKPRSILLGRNPEAGELLQFAVPAGCWFAARVKNPGTFSLVGCTVSPGFDFSDFEMAERNELISLYPESEELITSLSR
ncbi:MAG: cupin domain-containing protein [Bacteroidales bacterium]|nr:cupin domain-containing protein [Bacteroidales bacterium]